MLTKVESITEKEATDKKEEFKFYEPKNFKEKLVNSNFKKKYAISIWKVNRG